ncbi:fructuronate reductase [Pacificibacter maritimus]|uniref:Fructuronate reductase n=1 Tax=Pacificibacter maritimus TaxID=762213 RepID=A0A3N4U743_9RHOB|nr:mannitol dehydrogenase family protein [Pacificibacter maritimus]RPE66576.1 fructuronate reductase [Pacificibacter maritimus]
MNLLSNATLASIKDTDLTPKYDRSAHKVGIVHLGLGAFHKAHQAVYTDSVLAQTGGDWMIAGISMRNNQTAADITAQDGLYTVIEKASDTDHARVVGSIAQALCANDTPDQVLAILCDPATKIVTTTVTEKGYGIDRETGEIDVKNPVVAQDKTRQEPPRGVLGLIVAALQNRRALSLAPFTVLCCDNLPHNGAFLKSGVVSFARHVDPELAEWISDNVAFPSTMVDRITPAQSSDTLASAQACLRLIDTQAIETEPFHQWIIEDNFPAGRPNWDLAGAIFTDDVEPFEMMKLRLLNGSHSLIAYAGALKGHKFVRDVMNDDTLLRLVQKHMTSAAATLAPIEGINFTQYALDLIARFKNPNIAHETLQIATDGSQKMPQRIFAPAVEALNADKSIAPFAFATACWLWFCRGGDTATLGHPLLDPKSDELSRICSAETPDEIINGLFDLDGLLPQDLRRSDIWRNELRDCLNQLFAEGFDNLCEAVANQ